MTRSPWLTRVAAHGFLATVACGGAVISDVQITRFEQAALEVSFRVEWSTSGSDATVEAIAVDIWMLTKQANNPRTRTGNMLKEGIKDSGSLWVDAGDAWARGGDWDSNTTGEALVCVYETTDYFNNACSEALPILPVEEAPAITPGGGISNVKVPRLDRDGLNLFLSVTWADGGGAGGTEDTAQFVDIWFTAEQSNPRSWVQIPIKEDAQNDGLEHVDLNDSWATDGSWDATRDGEVRICVYDARDYSDNGCSDFQTFSASEDSGKDDQSDPGSADTDQTNSDSSQESGGVTATVAVLGIAVVVIAACVALSTRRRRQRRRWLGDVAEAEALPRDAEFETSCAIPDSIAGKGYSRF